MEIGKEYAGNLDVKVCTRETDDYPVSLPQEAGHLLTAGAVIP